MDLDRRDPLDALAQVVRRRAVARSHLEELRSEVGRPEDRREDVVAELGPPLVARAELLVALVHGADAMRRYAASTVLGDHLDVRVRPQPGREDEALAAGEHRRGHHGPDDGERAASDQGPAGAEVLGDPAQHRCSDRRAAQEDRHVQRHDAAPHLRCRRHLHEGVGGGDHRQRGEPAQRQEEGEASGTSASARRSSRPRRTRARRRSPAAGATAPAGRRAASRPASRWRGSSRGCRTRRRPCRRPRSPSAPSSSGSSGRTCRRRTRPPSRA